MGEGGDEGHYYEDADQIDPSSAHLQRVNEDLIGGAPTVEVLDRHGGGLHDRGNPQGEVPAPLACDDSRSHRGFPRLRLDHHDHATSKSPHLSVTNIDKERLRDP